MDKAKYKTCFVLFGVLILASGVTINYFSAEITNMFLAVDLSVLSRGKGLGIEQPPSFQVQYAEIIIKVISVLADIGGLLAVIYGFTSKPK